MVIGKPASTTSLSSLIIPFHSLNSIGNVSLRASSNNDLGALALEVIVVVLLKLIRAGVLAIGGIWGEQIAWLGEVMSTRVMLKNHILALSVDRSGSLFFNLAVSSSNRGSLVSRIELRTLILLYVERMLFILFLVRGQMPLALEVRIQLITREGRILGI